LRWRGVCRRRRRRLVLEARDGGSITPEAGVELREAQRRGELQLHEHCEVSTDIENCTTSDTEK
jgi:hypothetical protein